MSNKLKTFYYSVLSFQALSLCVEWFRMEFYHVNIPHIFLRPNLTEKVFKKIPEHQTNSCKYLFQIVDFFFYLGHLKTELLLVKILCWILTGRGYLEKNNIKVLKQMVFFKLSLSFNTHLIKSHIKSSISVNLFFFFNN